LSIQMTCEPYEILQPTTVSIIADDAIYKIAVMTWMTEILLTLIWLDTGKDDSLTILTCECY